MPLSGLSSDWASREAHGAGAKLHVVVDPDAATPVHFASPAKRSSDFAWWAKLVAQGCRIGTRLKKNTPTRVVTECLKGTRTHPPASDLREVHVSIETGKLLRIISNDPTSPAETIADLEVTRWQIELFFRWVEQTLRIRKLLGSSENAVRISSPWR